MTVPHRSSAVQKGKPSAPIFCHCIFVDHGVLRARLYVTGLGLWDYRRNGQPLTNAVLTPPNIRKDKPVRNERIGDVRYFKRYTGVKKLD